VGQAAAQGAGSQARQVRASKPVDSPPEEAMRMPAVFQDRFLCTRRAQASEQEWQPIQRSMRGAVRVFKAGSSYTLDFLIQHRVSSIQYLLYLLISL
jgi:hypothetical protein